MITESEIAFLNRHNLHVIDLFDGRGARPVEWKALVKRTEHRFVLRDPIPTCGHRIVTRSNSCCECRPGSISFQTRYRESGYIYLAQSAQLGAVKVGATQDLDDRLRQLNLHGYGGAKDWILVESKFTNEMGPIEAALISGMPGEKVSEFYLHRNTQEKSKEMFLVPLRAAQRFFRQIVNPD